MKDYLDLFTPVTEGLPNPGLWVTVINGDGNPYINKLPFHSSITHWLDLSKLTTKERVMEEAINFNKYCLEYEGNWPEGQIYISDSNKLYEMFKTKKS